MVISKLVKLRIRKSKKKMDIKEPACLINPNITKHRNIIYEEMEVKNNKIKEEIKNRIILILSENNIKDIDIYEEIIEKNVEKIDMIIKWLENDLNKKIINEPYECCMILLNCIDLNKSDKDYIICVLIMSYLIIKNLSEKVVNNNNLIKKIVELISIVNSDEELLNILIKCFESILSKIELSTIKNKIVDILLNFIDNTSKIVRNSILYILSNIKLDYDFSSIMFKCLSSPCSKELFVYYVKLFMIISLKYPDKNYTQILYGKFSDYGENKKLFIETLIEYKQCIKNGDIFIPFININYCKVRNISFVNIYLKFCAIIVKNIGNINNSTFILNEFIPELFNIVADFAYDECASYVMDIWHSVLKRYFKLIDTNFIQNITEILFYKLKEHGNCEEVVRFIMNILKLIFESNISIDNEFFKRNDYFLQLYKYYNKSIKRDSIKLIDIIKELSISYIIKNKEFNIFNCNNEDEFIFFMKLLPSMCIIYNYSINDYNNLIIYLKNVYELKKDCDYLRYVANILTCITIVHENNKNLLLNDIDNLYINIYKSIDELRIYIVRMFCKANLSNEFNNIKEWIYLFVNLYMERKDDRNIITCAMRNILSKSSNEENFDDILMYIGEMGNDNNLYNIIKYQMSDGELVKNINIILNDKNLKSLRNIYKMIKYIKFNNDTRKKYSNSVKRILCMIYKDINSKYINYLLLAIIKHISACLRYEEICKLFPYILSSINNSSVDKICSDIIDNFIHILKSNVNCIPLPDLTIYIDCERTIYGALLMYVKGRMNDMKLISSNTNIYEMISKYNPEMRNRLVHVVIKLYKITRKDENFSESFKYFILFILKNHGIISCTCYFKLTYIYEVYKRKLSLNDEDIFSKYSEIESKILRNIFKKVNYSNFKSSHNVTFKNVLKMKKRYKYSGKKKWEYIGDKEYSDPTDKNDDFGIKPLIYNIDSDNDYESKKKLVVPLCNNKNISDLDTQSSDENNDLEIPKRDICNLNSDDDSDKSIFTKDKTLRVKTHRLGKKSIYDDDKFVEDYEPFTFIPLCRKNIKKPVKGQFKGVVKSKRKDV